MEICIVGAGIAGLKIAYELSKNGCQVTLLEENEQLGGQLSFTRLGDLYVDKFYHIFSILDKNLLEFLKQLDLSHAIKPINAKYGFFWQGKQYPLTGIWDLIRFNPLTFLNRIRLGLTILYTKLQDWRKLQDRYAKEWLLRIGGARNFDVFWNPILKSKFRERSDKISAVDIWSRNKRMNYVTKHKACYLKGGFKTLLDKAEKSLIAQNVKILKKAKAFNIIQSSDSCFHLETSAGTKIFNKVILAIPTPSALKLLNNFPDYKCYLSKVEYMGNISLVLKLSHSITPYYMLAKGSEFGDITSIISYSGLYPDNPAEGYVINYVSHYFNIDSRLLEMSNKDILDHFLPQLSTINPEFKQSWIEAYTISKAPFFEPLVSLDYSSYLPDFRTPIKNLYLVTGGQTYPYTPVMETTLNVCNQFLRKFLSSLDGK